MSDHLDAIDRLLADAGADFASPPMSAVRWTSAPARHSPLRSALLAALIATLILAGAVLGAAALGIGPLRILFVEALPSANVPDQPLAARLALGSRTTTDDPSIRMPLLVPGTIGPPEEVYRSSDGWRLRQAPSLRHRAAWNSDPLRSPRSSSAWS